MVIWPPAGLSASSQEATFSLAELSALARLEPQVTAMLSELGMSATAPQRIAHDETNSRIAQLITEKSDHGDLAAIFACRNFSACEK
jgi:hypothetical protein